MSGISTQTYKLMSKTSSYVMLRKFVRALAVICLYGLIYETKCLGLSGVEQTGSIKRLSELLRIPKTE